MTPITLRAIGSMEEDEQDELIKEVYNSINLITFEILKCPSEFSLELLYEDFGEHISQSMKLFCFNLLVHNKTVWLVKYNVDDEMKNIYGRKRASKKFGYQDKNLKDFNTYLKELCIFTKD